MVMMRIGYVCRRDGVADDDDVDVEGVCGDDDDCDCDDDGGDDGDGDGNGCDIVLIVMIVIVMTVMLVARLIVDGYDCEYCAGDVVDDYDEDGDDACEHGDDDYTVVDGDDVNVGEDCGVDDDCACL